MIDWGEEFSVKHDEMDKQHEELIGYINEFYVAVKEQDPPLQLELLGKIQRFAIYHFQEEEALLVEHEYPELRKHIEIHEKLLSRIEELASELKENVRGASQTVNIFLKNWLSAHIQGIDMKYTEYVQTEQSGQPDKKKHLS